MRHIKIGNKILGKQNDEPAIAVVIDDYIPVEDLIKFKEKGASLFEVRFDLLDGTMERSVNYIKDVKVETGLPLIGTLRETEVNCGNRLSLFEQFIPFVDAIDIEIDTSIAEDVIILADKEAKVIIVSEHDFEKMPSDSELDKLVEKALDLGADIVKIAAMSSSLQETARLMRYNEITDIPLITIAMGSYGKLSRMAGMFFGSLYTYTFVNEGVAPGQIEFNELLHDIKSYYPGFKK